MLLSTCYKLVLANGADCESDDGYGHKVTCADLKRAFNVFGTPESFGLATPVFLSDVLERVSLDAALWSLRAVYPEQRTAARRIARSLAMDAALEGSRLFEGHKLYEQAWSVANAWLEGDASGKDLQSFRMRVFNTILPSGSLANYGLATYIMLTETPERYALEAINAGIKAGTPDGATKGSADSQALEFRNYVKSTFLDLLRQEEPTEEGSGPGEITEPSTKGRPVTNRRKLIIRYYGKTGGGATQAGNDSIKQSLMNWGL